MLPLPKEVMFLVVLVYLLCIWFICHFFGNDYRSRCIICFTIPINNFFNTMCTSSQLLDSPRKTTLIVQGITVLDLELRDGSRLFLPSYAMRSLVTSGKNLKLNSLRGWGIFGPRPFLVSVEMFSVTKVSTSVHNSPICNTFISFRIGLNMTNWYNYFDDLDGWIDGSMLR